MRKMVTNGEREGRVKKGKEERRKERMKGRT